MTPTPSDKEPPREFWIDVGGTFTDCIARGPDGRLLTHKLLSTSVYRGRVAPGSTAWRVIDPERRGDPPGFFRGFKFFLRGGHAPPTPEPAGADAAVPVSAFNPAHGAIELACPLDSEPPPGAVYELRSDLPAPVLGIHWLAGRPPGKKLGPIRVRIGTTRGTNALLERKGAATAFVTTAGLGDLLLIGDQTRPKLFDLHIRKPAPLHALSIELDERIDAAGRILKPLAAHEVRRKFAEAQALGIIALAVCLMNSYRNPAHELIAEEIARAIGFDEVTLSCRLSPLQGFLARAETSVINAYLGPITRRYLDALREHLPHASLLMMTSSGALAQAQAFEAKDGILSGPAGGVVGCAVTARRAGCARVIGFDMGGTSTDVSRYDGALERRHETAFADPATGGSLRIRAPMLAIETVAAGGGSICGFDGIKPTVGPASAGADPGPACYGRGGPLCVTDANLYLGRISQANFPFPLDRSAVEARLGQLCDEIARKTGRRYTREELAAGYVRIADEHMIAAIRRISIRRGYDPREHALLSFGGAGGQHACAVARSLGMREVLLPARAGVLSAFGIGVAAIERFAARAVGQPLHDDAVDVPAGGGASSGRRPPRPRHVKSRQSPETTGPTPGLQSAKLATWRAETEARLRAELADAGADQATIAPGELSLDLRYAGQDATITIEQPPDDDWRSAFEAAHERLYGFAFPGRAVEIHAARLRVAARPPESADIRREDKAIARGAAQADLDARRTTRFYFDGAFLDAPVLLRERLAPGDQIDGPALVLDATSTAVIEPDWRAEVLETGGIRLTIRARTQSVAQPPSAVASQADADRSSCDPITLELFNNHFADIAEQMGETLRRTALSTNVKDRLDFSCAVFDSAGELIAHAPHIPVHLGAMGQCVKCLLEDLGARDQDMENGRPRPDAHGQPGIRPGDVFVTNDPFRGGTHLPDVTVITPVFDAAGRSLLFFTASRAHHAEIGGVAPGSMPPQSRNLAEEGVLIRATRLVEAARRTPPPSPSKGEGRGEGAAAGASALRLNDDPLRRLLAAGPHPSRDIETNLADICAQAAANRCGAGLLTELIQRHGLQTVTAYMGHIKTAAERNMRSTLARLKPGEHGFTDYLDDGAPIAVKITIASDGAVIDFTGTGGVHPGNLNATPAIVSSAVLYCFRCLIAEDIPLNAGVLAPLRIILPEGLLNPPPHADPAKSPAVAAGNVETSQRIVDAIFGALGVAAASQGTMNTLSFGNERFGYYETLAGGAGAGPAFDGADAVHTHMTNTRLTDPEVLEARYPVRLRRFAIRRRSGGTGRHRGGDGILRQIEFLEPLEVSLLTQRRSRPPYGLEGGGNGRPGRNALRRVNSTAQDDLPPICHFRAAPGDVLTIETPGGGAYGE